MSRDASVSFAWADGEYTFRLRIGELRELQEKCDAGPGTIARRLFDRSFFVDDILQAIRLGLIGGGMAPTEALKLVRRYVEERPLEENRLPAFAIVEAALSGVSDEPIKKKRPRRTPATAGSASANSTAPAPPLDGHPETSIN